MPNQVGSYQVGVDLGTTYSAAAVCRSAGGPVEAVPLGQRASSVPSTVYVGADGVFQIGEAAERRALSDPGRVVREFKRRIGDPTPVLVGHEPVPAQELAARFLTRLLQDVTAREGSTPSRLALTHPAGWGRHKLDSLRSALTEHGLGSAVLLSEPQAAAVGYANAERVEPGAVVAVYDLGGGTFDAAVVRKAAGGGFDLLGRPEGLEQLGGVDFDEVVFAHVRAAIGADWESLDPTDSEVLAAVAGLRRECTAAKEALSHDTEVSVSVLLPGICTRVRLGRTEFEEMIRPAVLDTVAATRRALDSAGVSAAELGALLLVGGSSRIPLVTQLLAEEFGRSAAVDVDPKGVIAAGAALVAREAERSAGRPGRPPVGPTGSRSAGPGVAVAPIGTGPGTVGSAVPGVAGASARTPPGAVRSGSPGPRVAPAVRPAAPGPAPAVTAGATTGRFGTTGPGSTGPGAAAPEVAGGAGEPDDGTPPPTVRNLAPVGPALRPPKQARPFTAVVDEPSPRGRRVAVGVAAGVLALALLGGAVAFGINRIGANQEAGASTPPTPTLSAVPPPAPTETPPATSSSTPPPPAAPNRPPSRARTRPPAPPPPPPQAPPPPVTTTTPAPPADADPGAAEDPPNNDGDQPGDDAPQQEEAPAEDAGRGGGSEESEDGADDDAGQAEPAADRNTGEDEGSDEDAAAPA